MVKTFKDFLGEELFETVINPGSYDEVPDNKMSQFLDSANVDFVSDDRFFSKIANILKKRIIAGGFKVSVYPYIVTIDGDRGVLLNITNGYSIICFRNSLKKRVELFKGFDINSDNESIYSLSTSIKGFSDIIDTVMMIIGNGGSVHESLEPLDRLPQAIPWRSICGAIKDCPFDVINDLLHEFASNSDREIKNNFIAASIGDESSVYGIIKSYFGPDKSANVWDRRVAALHLMLCGTIPPEASAYCSDIKWIGIAAGHSTVGDVADELDGIKEEPVAIDITEGRSVKVTSAAAKLDAQIERLELDMNDVHYMADAMCKVIKSNGNDSKRFQRRFGKHRALLVTGVAGIGKTTGIDQALRKNNMQEYSDYYVVGNVSTGANELYYTFYQYSNALIIFDDTPELFDSELKISLWKAAIGGNEKERTLTRPFGTVKGASGDSKYDGMFYNVGDMDRQDRYFKEVGKKTREEKAEWIAKEAKRIMKEGLKKDPDTGAVIGEVSPSDAENMAKRNWNNIESKKLNPLIPDRFTFNGLVIIVTNMSLANFRKSAKDHWDAINRRAAVIEIAPDYPTVWGWLKRKLVAEIDGGVAEKDRLIPSVYAEDFISFVDDVMAGKHNSLNGKDIYGVINFGTIANLSEMMEIGVEDGEPFENFKRDILLIMKKL